MLPQILLSFEHEMIDQIIQIVFWSYNNNELSLSKIKNLLLILLVLNNFHAFTLKQINSYN